MIELQHINVKLFLRNPGAIDPEALIPVFHGWIQDRAGDELLLDVADYRHVPSGPGLVLIGHEGNYSLDHAGGRWSIRYNRKAALQGTNQERLTQATQAALLACQRLESDARLDGMIQFDGRELEVFINDRLLAPNSPPSRGAADPEFGTFFSTLFDGLGYSATHAQDPRSLLSVHVRTLHKFDTASLLDNLNLLAPAARP